MAKSWLASEHPWYALDHAALIYPPLLSDRISAYYRLQATLDEEVDLALLQTALDAVRKRFPYFQVELRRGFFWYFFEPSEAPSRVVQDSKFPMQKLSARRKGAYLYRVRAFDNRVALEMCHILTDGHGAFIFFRSLLAEYYKLQGIATAYDEATFDPEGSVDSSEWEDAFSRYARPGAPKPERKKRAWHLPGLPMPIHTMRVTTAVLSLERTLAKAKERGSTLTVYLAAVYLAALQEVQEAEARARGAGRREVLRLQVPANLRNFFPSSTLRNFSLFSLPDIDPRLGHYELPEIIRRVKAMMALAFDPKELERTITRNVMTTRNPLIRAIPLPLKNLAMRSIYRVYGESTYTSLSTNVGPSRMPESFASRVLRVDVILPSTPGLKTVAGIVSHGDALSISFGSVIERSGLERAFCTALVKEGLKVKVESNLPSLGGKE